MLKVQKEIESKVPSRMIRQSKWVVTTSKTLKAKQQTVVITSSILHQEKEAEVDIMPSYHVTISDNDHREPTIEEDAEEAPPNFKEGNKATVDELKEINLGTVEDLRPIFLNINLSQEE